MSNIKCDVSHTLQSPLEHTKEDTKPIKDPKANHLQ